MSVAAPGDTVAEERARLGCAYKRLPSGQNRPLRSIKLLKRVVIFIKLGGAMETGCAPEGQG